MGPHSKRNEVKYLSIEEKASVKASIEADFSAKQVASRLRCYKAGINLVLSASKSLPNMAVPKRKKALIGPGISQVMY
jgi:predicted sulfurtransferase